jgi:hypothetical protein
METHLFIGVGGIVSRAVVVESSIEEIIAITMASCEGMPGFGLTGTYMRIGEASPIFLPPVRNFIEARRGVVWGVLRSFGRAEIPRTPPSLSRCLGILLHCKIDVMDSVPASCPFFASEPIVIAHRKYTKKLG